MARHPVHVSSTVCLVFGEPLSEAKYKSVFNSSCLFFSNFGVVIFNTKNDILFQYRNEHPRVKS